MKRYIVTIKEVHDQEIAVSAESEEQALDKAQGGNGDYVNGSLYQYSLDRDSWEVRED
tara:strand:- start:395 stop:568 length:174 start_codon:yes stop_codon:yes gene_type:complete